MNGSIAPVVAAAAIARARRRIAETLLVQDATAPDRAVPFIPENGIQRRQFSWMLRKAMVRESRPGAYWLDAEAYAAMVEARRRRITLVAGMVCIVLAALVLLAYRGAG